MKYLKVGKEIILGIDSCHYLIESQISKLHIKGWVFSKKSKDPLKIEILELEPDNIKIMQYERQDVLRTYPVYEGALCSGFTIMINDIEKKENIKVSFKDDTKTLYILHTRKLERLFREKSLSRQDSNSKVRIIKNQNSTKKLMFDMVKEPLVSIIIPVYNNWYYTYYCLQSIFENTKRTSYEIIVGDDVSNDETVDILNYVENIVLIRNNENLGFLLNCNNAAKFAKGKYLLFLNNDTKVHMDWLKYLVELIESDESIGMVGSKLIYPDGRLQEAGGIVWKNAKGFNYGRLDDSEKSEYNYVKEVDYISGASIMIRRTLWEEIGGFDKRYSPAYFEDTDLSFEVRKHGYKVMYQPKSVVIHYEGKSHGTDIKSGIKHYQEINREKFINKWKEVLQKDHFKGGKHVFWARDRSTKKKTILVIDYHVPNYDKDAGSATVYQYLKLLVEQGFNVKFIGDSYYRQEPYTSDLQSLGIEVLYGYWYSKNYKKWIKDNAKYIDYVYLNRPHISTKYIDFIKKNTNAKIITN